MSVIHESRLSPPSSSVLLLYMPSPGFLNRGTLPTAKGAGGHAARSVRQTGRPDRPDDRDNIAVQIDIENYL